MIWLEHDESRSYGATFKVLDGQVQINEAERRIVSIAKQPQEDFPAPSGRYPRLGEGSRS
jgi:hypothetical protein